MIEKIFGFRTPGVMGLLAIALAGLVAMALRVDAAAETWSLVNPVFGEEVRAVVRGDSQWVAVGSRGVIATSPDARRWTNRAAGTTADLSAVCYGAGRYVAGGDNSLLLVSTDAATWTVGRAAGSGTGAPIVGTAFGNGVFVAVQVDATVLTSANGSAWSEQRLLVPDRFPFLRSVIFANGLFVAVGGVSGGSRQDCLIYISADGVNWARSAPDLVIDKAGNTGGITLRAVTYGGGQFVAVGDSDGIITSTDGINWQNRRPLFPSQSNELTSVSYGNGVFIAGADIYRRYLTSPDGVAWSSVDIPAARFPGLLRFRAIAFADGMFVATALDGRVAVKTATEDWLLASGFYASQRTGVTYGNGRFIITGSDGSTASTADGLLWAGKEGNGYGFSRPAYGNGRFVASSSTNGTQGIYTSTDGLAWTGQPFPGPLNVIVYARGKFVGAGYAMIASSADGLTWSQDASLAGKYFVGLAEGNSRFVAVGQFGAVATSDDGLAWSLRPPPITGHFSALAFGSGRFVAGESNSLKLWSTADGVTWDPAVLPVAPAGGFSGAGISDVIYAPGRFTATLGADLLTSTDGLTWEVVPRAFGQSPSPQFLLAYGNGRYLAVGASGRIYLSSPDDTGISITATSGDSLIVAGQTAVVSVSATGANLTYQWYRGAPGDVSLPIAGATATSYTTSGPPSDAALWVRVSNATTFVDSPAMLVNLMSAPIFAGGTSQFELPVGQSATFSVQVSAVPMPTLQWYQGNPGDISHPVAAANGSALTVTAGTTTQRYWVRASNPAGVTDSGQFRVTPWSAATGTGVPATIYSMAYGAGRFIALGFNATYTSDDGLVWRLITPDISSQGSGRIAYGAGQFVVTSDIIGLIYLSTDGVAWEQRRIVGATSTFNGVVAAGSGVFLLPNTVNDIAYGRDRYVAVGNGISISADGATWTPLGSIAASFFTAVTYGNGTFVAVGAEGGQGLLLTSTDGLTWQKRTAPTLSNGLYDLAFVGDRFLLATSEGLAFSPDGVTWQLVREFGPSLLNVSPMNGLAFATGRNATEWRRAADGVAVAISSISPAMEIARGSTATLSVVATGSALGYQWYRGPSGDTSAPLAGATSATVTVPAATTNQRYWVRVTGAAGNADSATLFVAIAGPPVIVAEPYSADVVASVGSFTLSVAAESYSALSYQWFQGRPGDVSRLVAGGAGESVSVPSPVSMTRFWVRVSNAHGSTDSAAAVVTPWVGVSLSSAALPFSTSGLAYGQGRCVVTGLQVGPGSPGFVQVSSHGQNWTATASPGLGPVAFGGGKFVAVAQIPSNTVFHSSDGVSWTQIGLSGTTARFTEVFFVGNRFLAVSDTGTLAISADGINWTLRTLGSGRLFGAAYGNGRYVVCGAGGQFFYSPDSLAWTSVTGPAAIDFVTVVFGAGKFFAVASDYTVLVSADGTGWSPASVRTSDNLLTIRGTATLSFAGGRFFGGPSSYLGNAYNSSEGDRWWPGIYGMARVVEGGGTLFATNNTTVVTIGPSGLSVGAAGDGMFYRAVPELPVPVVSAPPSHQTVFSGQSATFSVAATSDTTVSYQWRRNGVDVPGATGATLTLGNVQPSDAGTYYAVVTNAAGSAGSIAATLTVTPAPAIVSASGAKFIVGRPGGFSLVVSGMTSATWTISAGALPSWATLNSTTGLISGTPPDATGSPFALAVTATNGIVPSATQNLTLVIQRGHSADVSPTDGTLNLAELTRVIELYNTSTGTVRTGRYVVSSGSVDGYAPDSAVTAGPIPTNPHTADLNRDGRLSLPELTRVIELFNTRAGTTRTGAYHAATSPTSTEDGFAPGP